MYKLFKDEDVIYAESSVQETVTLRRKFFSGTIHMREPISWHSSSASGSLYTAIYDRDPDDFSSNKLLTVSYGSTPNSDYTGGGDEPQKNRVYKMYAKRFLGNSDAEFSLDKTSQSQAFFLSLPRNLAKDGINENENDPFILSLISDGYHSATPTIHDFSLSKETESHPGGAAHYLISGNVKYGLVFKEAATIVFTKVSFFDDLNAIWSGSLEFQQCVVLETNSLASINYGIRNHIHEIKLSNISNLRNTIYQCELEKHEFNYSSNKSFVDRFGQIISTSGSFVNSQTRTYVTSVGLIGKNHELIAVGKLSRPVKKDPDTQLVINVKLDY